ncbi:MAG TPA: class I SAM-dependent methyltransferase [Pyrinomonadaceae bacterium]|nr:class I SAM-dependent methyltransferase [Pyrinomonadaceae bacterium]
MSQNWWQNFFHGVALDFWRAAVPEEHTRAEAGFIKKHLQVVPGGKILDVPCGNGRLSLALAARGFQLTGVDIATEFIEEARAKSAERGLPIEWHNREMRDLPWTDEFEGAFCFGNSFGYLDDEGNADFLGAVCRALKSRARFIIDYGAVAEALLPILEEERSFEIGGIALSAKSQYDYEQARLITDYTFSRDGLADTRPSSQRVYSYRELAILLAETGFTPEAAYGSALEEPFKLRAQRLLLVSRKTA